MVEPKLTAKQWDLRFEEDLVKVWASEPDLYAFDPDRGPTYVIDTPPPYPSVSGHRRQSPCLHRSIPPRRIPCAARL